MEFGEQFVINPGMTLMLEWHVLRWDTLQEVRIKVTMYDTDVVCHIHIYWLLSALA